LHGILLTSQQWEEVFEGLEQANTVNATETVSFHKTTTRTPRLENMGHQATYAGDAKSLIVIELAKAMLHLNQLVVVGMLMTIDGRTCLPS